MLQIYPTESKNYEAYHNKGKIFLIKDPFNNIREVR